MTTNKSRTCRCILVEMHIGQPLFNGKNELQQMFKICDVLGLPPRHMIRDAGPKSKVRAVFKEVPGTKNYQIVMDDKVMDQVRRHHSRHTTMPLQVVDPIAYAFSGMWGFIDARCTVHDTCFTRAC